MATPSALSSSSNALLATVVGNAAGVLAQGRGLAEQLGTGLHHIIFDQIECTPSLVDDSWHAIMRTWPIQRAWDEVRGVAVAAPPRGPNQGPHLVLAFCGGSLCSFPVADPQNAQLAPKCGRAHESVHHSHTWTTATESTPLQRTVGPCHEQTRRPKSNICSGPNVLIWRTDRRQLLVRLVISSCECITTPPCQRWRQQPRATDQ